MSMLLAFIRVTISGLKLFDKESITKLLKSTMQDVGLLSANCIIRPRHEKNSSVACAPSQNLDQPGPEIIKLLSCLAELSMNFSCS